MMCYSIEPRDRIFVKSYGFLCFARSMSKNIGKSIINNLSDKCSQKRFDHTKQSATDNLRIHLRLSTILKTSNKSV